MTSWYGGRSGEYDAVADAAKAVDAAKHALDVAVHEARKDPAWSRLSWDDIAAAVGISKAAAHKRWRHVADRIEPELPLSIDGVNQG